MKNTSKILIVIFICIVMYLSFDFIQYKINEKELNDSIGNVKINIPPFFKYYTEQDWFTQSINSYKTYYKFLTTKFRPENISENNKKGSILIFGCSYAYGSQLSDEESFGYKLFKYTNRNTFNKSLEACGIQHMYYLLEQEEFYKTLPNDIEYVIFVYIPNHIDRINKLIFPSPMLTNGAYLQYKLNKNNKLILKKHMTILYKSFLMKKIFSNIDEKNSLHDLKEKKESINIAIELFTKSREHITKKYPNAEFVILKYVQDFDSREFNEDSSLWEELEKRKFKVVSSSSLIGREFTKKDTTSDGTHPKSETWDILIPYLADELKL